MHIWKEDTLKCSENNLRKQQIMWKRKREAVDFQPLKTLKKKLTSHQTSNYYTTLTITTSIDTTKKEKERVVTYF